MPYSSRELEVYPVIKTDELLENAKRYEEAFEKGDLPLPPAAKVAVVACMDARLNPYALLGLEEGDAHVIATRAASLPTMPSGRSRSRSAS
jgi:carbonic anhydrase